MWSKKVVRYRFRHPRCRYCKWLKSKFVGIEQHHIWECLAKDKCLSDFHVLKMPQWFCGCYEAETEFGNE